jgi:hypothetical protein
LIFWTLVFVLVAKVRIETSRALAARSKIKVQKPKTMVLSGWESVFFWFFSIAAILAGLLTVMARNAVHSALFLILFLVSVAALVRFAGRGIYRRRPNPGLCRRRDGALSVRHHARQCGR